ncbi:diaminobutyrate aminotransferase [Haloactinopolyspora alba]|uniref:Diaminobutyrate--2-oxoglutarate transaminase n=1 Tax=Haloactinopolyspora alba TaxID=648780 RepID=A0A2P8EFH2_9ACTN|nr:diaminobutyrate--2-oxoglutarate transaminase family protein [Haloactinopolyspora alba]PSL08200.1 diaminobutyrate aminotransferase [Haloactinopolyspora alba]
MAYSEGVRLAEPPTVDRIHQHHPAPATGTADELFERQRRRESSARSYPRRLPVALVEGSGSTVRDRHGTAYIDCLAGAGALALGHHHPVVVEAIRSVLDDGAPLSTLDLPSPTRDRFVETLFDALPEPMRTGKLLICGPTGADAVEAAVKLARTATARSGVLAFGGAYHGMTQGTLALTGRRSAKEALGPLLGEVHHLPFPTTYRSPFGADDTAAVAARLVEWALTDDHSGIAAPAAAVVEPVQGEGGVHPMPPAFASALRRSTRAAGTVLVADEVQTGLGRTGTLWAGDAVGLDPDVLVLSKAIGGGLPLAVVVHHGELDGWPAGSHAGTFRGSTPALAAGAATIREVRRAGLAEHAADVGHRLTTGLRTVSAGDARVGDVRGRGLMLGVEMVDPDTADPDGVPLPDGALAARVQAEMLGRGVIVEVGGAADAVVRFLPPLVLTAAEADQVVDAFGAALRATRGGLG